MPHPVFHVRHNARPSVIRETLDILGNHVELTLDEVLREGADRGYQVGTSMRSKQSLKENPVQTARELGLIEHDRLALSDLGRSLVELMHRKPGAFGEVMHALFYTLWTPSEREEHCSSWSYRTLCNILWQGDSGPIDQAQLVSRVSELAMEEFDTRRVSFSKDSVRGVLQWLAELRPPVLAMEGKGFERRTFCPPETVALAVDHLYRTEGADYQTNLLLDATKQERLCRLCLLELTSFEVALDWASGQYSFLDRGGSGGWGAYVVLSRKPQVCDFLG